MTRVHCAMLPVLIPATTTSMQFKHLPAIFSFHDAILDNPNYAVMNKKFLNFWSIIYIVVPALPPLASPFVERKRTYSPFNRLHQTSLVCASQTINNSVIQSVIQVPPLDFFQFEYLKKLLTYIYYEKYSFFNSDKNPEKNY